MTSLSRRAAGLWLGVILSASLVPRLPVLHNAAHEFNSDEAVNALVIRHLLERGELTFHNWDATYYGIAEGLIAIPFVWIDGYTPVAFKLAAISGFLLLVLATYLLGRKLFGAPAGLVAAGLLAAFSPQLVQWSTLASGGYTLVIAWGTLTVLAFEALRTRARAPAAWQWLLFGVMVGFGLYIYELYLVYAATLGLYAAAAFFPRRRDALRAIPGQLRAAVLLAAGVVLGWAPKLALLFTGATGSKRPSYEFAKPERMGNNLELLLDRCAPALLGANPEGSRAKDMVLAVGEPWALAQPLSILLLAFYAGAWVWGLRRTWSARGDRSPAETVLLLLVPVAALLFVLSPNPQDVFSSRYLLPWLSSLPIFAGALIARLGRRSLPLGVAAGLFLIAFPLVQIVRVQQARGYLGPDLRIASQREPLEDVVRYLRAEGVPGAYGPYWVAYEATFLSGERTLVVPLLEWDRYPEYTRRVQTMRNVAYVFDENAAGETHRMFLEALQRAGKRARVRRFDHYLVYTDPARDRLLPAYALAPPRPLERPAARIEILAPPAAVAPRGILFIPVRVTNTGSEVWSALGIGSGNYRVSVAYRLFDAKGAAVVFDGERTLLPWDVPPGGTAELKARVPAPEQPGEYRLVLTMVQENVAWFDAAAGAEAVAQVRVE